MSNTTKKIKENVMAIQMMPEYEVSYFDAKEANELVEVKRTELRRSVKALRVFIKGKTRLEMNVQIDYSEFKTAVNEAKVITNQYIKQCQKSRF